MDPGLGSRAGSAIAAGTPGAGGDLTGLLKLARSSAMSALVAAFAVKGAY